MATGEIPRSLSSPGEGALSGDARRPYPLSRVAGAFQMKARASDDSPQVLAAGLEALDFLRVGVAVTNGTRQLLFANQTAEHILLAHDGLEVNTEGVLVSLDISCGLSLVVYQAVQAAAQAGIQEPTNILLTVRRSAGRRPLTLLVRSLDAGSNRADQDGPAFLVFMWDPELPVRDVEARLRQLFGLTSCEARLCNLLMEGKTVEECSIELEIRPSTARVHLASVFAKTGVRRQGQLVSLLWKSVGMICTQREEPLLGFAEMA